MSVGALTTDARGARPNSRTGREPTRDPRVSRCRTIDGFRPDMDARGSNRVPHTRFFPHACTRNGRPEGPRRLSSRGYSTGNNTRVAQSIACSQTGVVAALDASSVRVAVVAGAATARWPTPLGRSADSDPTSAVRHRIASHRPRPRPMPRSVRFRPHGWLSHPTRLRALANPVRSRPVLSDEFRLVGPTARLRGTAGRTGRDGLRLSLRSTGAVDAPGE
jgi:hypothetical protein